MQGLQPPFDAFWGARYAIVEDPDGNPVAPDQPGRSGPPLAAARRSEPSVAVYTDISDAELEAFLAGYDLGAPLVVQGHRRGGGELQLPAGDRPRPLSS